MSSPLSTPGSFPVCPASRVTPRPVEWLWPGRLAFGKLAILDGDPGLGKSLIALDLCARLSTGRCLPDGSPGPGPAVALVLNGEDDAADTTVPRLRALGADLDRVFVLDRNSPGITDLPCFPDGADFLDEVLTRTRARLAVLDPVMAFLDPRMIAGSEAAVRRVLAVLARLADRHRCHMQLIRHLNKTAGRRALYRGGGSIAFVAACRSGWVVARDPREPQRCVLAQLKNNLAPPQPSLAYALTSPAPGVEQPAGGGEQPLLSWLGPVAYTADELLAGLGVAQPVFSVHDRARDFLEAFLEEGPRTARAIWVAAQQQGLSERTLYRARQELGIRSTWVVMAGRPVSYWLLRDQQLPDSATGTVADDLEQWLAPLREQYPPLTPLDEE